MPDVLTSFNDRQFQRQVFLPRVNQALAASPLFTSGLLTRNPILDQYAAGTGLTFTVPVDNALAAQDQMFGEGDVVQSYGLTGTAQNGVRTLRQTALGYYDHSAALTGTDPLGKITSDIGAWTTNANAAIVFAVLAGLFGTAGALNDAGHLVKIASESISGQSAATKFSAATLLTGAQTAAGQNAGSMSIILCNSYIFLQMQLSNLVQNVTTVAVGDSKVTFGTWLTYTVVVMDALTSRPGTTDGRVYRSYVVAPGVLQYGDGLNDKFQATETERTPSAAKTKLIYRRGLVVHPTGCSYVNTPADLSAGPSNTEYATPASWSQVFADSDIKIMAFDTN